MRLDALQRWAEEQALRRVPAHIRVRIKQRVRARPTREGAWFLGVVCAVILAAINTGNNLLYMVLGALLGILVLNNILAEWNMRGVTVRRHVPDEAWAGGDALGAILIENRRRLGAVWSLRITDHVAVDTSPLAVAFVAQVAARDSARVATRWRFSERGRCVLGALRIESTFPFGLMRRWRELDAPAEMVVYPRLEPYEETASQRAAGYDDHRQVGRGGSGELWGLRPYVPGDPLRNIHWATTARRGSPMVVERSPEANTQVMVRVARSDPRQREREISRAAAALVHHVAQGDAVGLELDGERWEPAQGSPWRRLLLVKLALAPRGQGA